MSTGSLPNADAKWDIEYDLYTHSDTRFRLWGPTDLGLRLAPDRIGWTADGQPCETPFDAIVEIHLSPPVMTAPMIVMPGSCSIRFRDGRQLSTSSVGPSGVYNPLREPLYRDFVLDLHRRLNPEQRSSITFTSGVSESRYQFNKMVFLLACLFCAGIIAVFLSPAESPWAALIMGAFVAVMLGFAYRVMRATAPRPYDPQNIPDGLLTVHALPYVPRDEGPSRLTILLQRTFGPSWPTVLFVAFSVVAFVGAAAALVWGIGARETERMFEPGEIERALKAVRQRSGRPLHVRSIEITARELTVEARYPDGPGHIDRDGLLSRQENWHVTHVTFFSGWREWDRVAGPEPVPERSSVILDAGDLDPGKIRVIADVARTALDRAAVDRNGATLRMHHFEGYEGVRPDKWVVTVEEASGLSREAVFDRDGKPFSDIPTEKKALSADGPAVELQVSAGDAFGRGAAARERQDYAEAVSWYRRAAEQGLPEAQFNLGVSYATGQGVPLDDAEAARWFRAAAEQGLAPAQNMLGVFYHDGRGVARDTLDARHWYRAAADQGYAASQLHLGTLYATGDGVLQDYDEAVLWYRKAADQGVPAAQYNLGLLYDRGLGVEADKSQARLWMAKAAAGGHALAQQWLEAN